MEPLESEFEFPRGDTCPISFDITDNDGNELNMQEAELIMTVRESQAEKANIIFSKKYSKGEIQIDGKKGSLVITHNDTANLKMNTKYYFDIQFSSGDYVKTAVIGNFKLTKEITY